MQKTIDPFHVRLSSFSGYFSEEATQFHNKVNSAAVPVSVPAKGSQQKAGASSSDTHSNLAAGKVQPVPLQHSDTQPRVAPANDSNVTGKDSYIDPYDNLRHEIWLQLRAKTAASTANRRHLQRSSKHRKHESLQDGVAVVVQGAPITYHGEGYMTAYYAPPVHVRRVSSRDDIHELLGGMAPIGLGGYVDEDDLLESDEDLPPAAGFAAVAAVVAGEQHLAGSQDVGIWEATRMGSSVLTTAVLAPPGVHTAQQHAGSREGNGVTSPAAAWHGASPSAAPGLAALDPATGKRGTRRGMRELRGIQDDAERTLAAADSSRTRRLAMQGAQSGSEVVELVAPPEQRPSKRWRGGQESTTPPFSPSAYGPPPSPSPRGEAAASGAAAPVDRVTPADHRAKLAAEIKSRLPDGVSSKNLPVKVLLRTGVLAGQPVEYRKGGSLVMNTGSVTAEGSILCGCSGCKDRQEVSCSQFEEHAGSTARRPAENIWLVNYEMHLKELGLLVGSEQIDTHIGHCLLCQDGGDLLCCDGCTAAYHPACLAMEHVPEADSWFCAECMEAGRDIRSLQQPRGAPSGRKSAATKRSGKGSLGGFREKASGAARKSPPPPRHSTPPPLPSTNPGTGRLRMAAPTAYVSAARTHQRNFNKHKRLFLGEPGALRDGERVKYVANSNSRQDVLLEGRVVLGKEATGILCDHCGEVLSCSAFEVHAGRGSRRAPYDSILCEQGITLRELALRLPAVPGGEDVGPTAAVSGRPARGRGGRKSAPSRQRAEAGGEMTGWEENDEDAKADAAGAETEEGGDPFAFDRGCMLCGQTDFDRTEFGPRTIIICDQCECEFHVSCLREHQMCDLQALPEGDWFCTPGCKCIKDTLEGAVLAGDTPISDSGHSWVIMHGRNGSISTGKLLRTVLDILQESFDPIIELASGVDLLPHMVHAEQQGDWDYSGMYALLLRHQKRPVCAALFRVYGTRLAELPLVATKQAARRQGHARVLVTALERLLAGAGVEQLLLPAAHETVKAWQTGFGFSHMPDEELEAVTHDLRVLIFPGTQVMKKALDVSACPPGLLLPAPANGNHQDLGEKPEEVAGVPPEESPMRSDRADSSDLIEMDAVRSGARLLRTPRLGGIIIADGLDDAPVLFSPEL